jgi:hypothetical protein
LSGRSSAGGGDQVRRLGHRRAPGLGTRDQRVDPRGIAFERAEQLLHEIVGGEAQDRRLRLGGRDRIPYAGQPRPQRLRRLPAQRMRTHAAVLRAPVARDAPALMPRALMLIALMLTAFMFTAFMLMAFTRCSPRPGCRTR